MHFYQHSNQNKTNACILHHSYIKTRRNRYLHGSRDHIQQNEKTHLIPIHAKQPTLLNHTNLKNVRIFPPFPIKRILTTISKMAKSVSPAQTHGRCHGAEQASALQKTPAPLERCTAPTPRSRPATSPAATQSPSPSTPPRTSNLCTLQQKNRSDPSHQTHQRFKLGHQNQLQKLRSDSKMAKIWILEKKRDIQPPSLA